MIAVWEPILRTDVSAPGTAILGRLSDRRIQQYWDPGHQVAKNLADAIVKHEKFPRPSCCVNAGFYWDLVAVFPKETEWEETLPIATFVDGPVVDVTAKLSQVLAQTR